MSEVKAGREDLGDGVSFVDHEKLEAQHVPGGGQPAGELRAPLSEPVEGDGGRPAGKFRLGERAVGAMEEQRTHEDGDQEHDTSN
jgi:hypothetical protein